MKFALALILLFAAWTPAKALDAFVFSLQTVNEETGVIVDWSPYEDLSKEECTKRLKNIVAHPPAKTVCVSRVVQREFC